MILSYSKNPLLKKTEGIIWEYGYGVGDLRGEVYPDVPESLRLWKEKWVYFSHISRELWRTKIRLEF